MIQDQPWKPPYKVAEVPLERARLLFPENYFSATIIGDTIQLSISTDIGGLQAVMARLEVLRELLNLPIPQRAIFVQPRDAVEGDFICVEDVAAQGIVTEGGDANAAPVSEAN